MTLILTRLGATYESEIFIGSLLDKSKFLNFNYTENFYILSQMHLLFLQKEMLQLYRNEFDLDFHNIKKITDDYKRIFSATYMVSYYFIGCYNEYITDKIEKDLLLWREQKEKNIFLGLIYLVFSDFLIYLKSNSSNSK